MKKSFRIAILICSLAATALLWMQAGSQFMKQRGGANPLEADESFADAEGEYISYDVAYPVAIRNEEYYSGDPTRVKKAGYVVYDAERKEFLYVVIPQGYNYGYETLMRNLSLSVEMRESKDMTPINVDGSLESADQDTTAHVFEALGESDVLELYADLAGDSTYMNAYFSDEYGKVMEEMCDRLLSGWEQKDLYVLELQSIGGLTIGEIWINIFAAALSALIFLFSLIGFFTGGKKGKANTDSGNQNGRYSMEQREWVEEWCTASLKKGYRSVIGSVLGSIVILGAIGFFANAADRLMIFYLPLGVLIGELLALMFWFAQKGQAKPDKLMKKLEKGLEKQLASAGERDAFMEDFVNTGKDWAFKERTKEAMCWGKLGEKFFSSFSWNGQVTVVDTQRLAEIYTETVSGTVRVGRVRTVYASYVTGFCYTTRVTKGEYDKVISFNTENGHDFFMTLLKKRIGDTIRIINKG